MADENNIVPRENDSNGHVELVPVTGRFASFDLSPREPHLYDYLLILRKHQWLILSFMLSVVTIVSIATFRMQPVYVATARIEIDKENSNILPFQGGDPYDYMLDSDNYIETQAKILTSQTLALQTIRNNELALRLEFAGSGGISEAVANGNLANQTRPPELAQFLGNLSVKRVPNSRLMDVSFESTDPRLAARTVNAHIATYIEQNYRSKYEATSQASDWLADQLRDFKIKVQKSEDARIA
ncbi:MAG TPA: Wzz/FepE/Etk N-terminal domain-containing protein, partial [Candidatus Acidoferrum sp.]|nr:Wzz/FepE/Etk N-terminal domain-containing protein [Candidatus Acidoferrum sp.]